MEKAAPLIDIHRLIATIVPDLYCDPTVRQKVKRLIRRGLRDGNVKSYLDAASVAEPVEGSGVDLQDLETIDPFSKKILETPVERRRLILDSMDEPVEAIYFSILDAFKAGEGWRVEKLEDSIHATSGSSVHGDLLHNQIEAQKQSMELLRQVHGLVHSILQNLEELRGDARSASENRTETRDGVLDIRRAQLRAQFEQLKIYARWLQPWLSAGESSARTPGEGHTLADAFNTAQLRILFLATKELSIPDYVSEGRFPRSFLRKKLQTFYATLVVEVDIRASPRRAVTGAHQYQGRTRVALSSYALSESELEQLSGEFDRQAVTQLLASTGNQMESIDAVIQTLGDLLDDQPGPTSKTISDDANPFATLASVFADWLRGLKTRCAGNSAMEEIIRAAALIEARQALRSAVAQTPVGGIGSADSSRHQLNF